ncbi:TDP-N-acetylfucosamine:lipid II N-acetylfucosaminyltransferase [Agarivorans albus]|uniref:4-alpha-L-fucosyltransferase n=1 Tax=Agarivorans albus MKT 106 TaxID=1331007 RepID=R9PMZ6_AGAAL|nr:TDP-N-acetylfucosamine:lipid II N-acetylfucosaminyltransferase [Agarivorans albus]GAD02752.1 4-alpha-L-fucosyltransferase [Agarivorans albus MKT 106]
MRNLKHLHIVGNEMKFIKPFIQYVNSNFDAEEHFFLVLNSNKESSVEMAAYKNVKIAKPFDCKNSFLRKLMLVYKVPSSMVLLLWYFNKAKKIYLHGLFDKKVIIFLYVFKSFSNKVYWQMWGGGDLDIPTKAQSRTLWYRITKKVKGRFSGYVSYLPGDYKLAQELYGSKGEFFEALMYESNTFNEVELNKLNDGIVRIQVGNSADSANNHFEIFNKLEKFKDENIEIYCILSYGEKPWSPGWAQKVIKRGEDLFGHKFIPVIDFMSFEEYLGFLGKIDIAIFAHKRQQAMGNTISLLGLGKKVYLRSDVTSWELFKDIGVKVFDVNELSISTINSCDQQANIEMIKSNFSKEKYHQQLRDLFEGF